MNSNTENMQQDQYAANRAFLAYQEAVETWAHRVAAVDRAEEEMRVAARVLRKFMKAP